MAIVGGSFAKRTNDEHSDVDISLITSDSSIVTLKSAIFSMHDILYHEVSPLNDHVVFLENSTIFDIHLTTDFICKRLILSFETAEDISAYTQDFIWNICNGNTIVTVGDCPSYKVIYTSKVRQKILNKYIPILSTQKLKVAFKRNDLLHQWETLLSISKTLVNVGCAMNSELFCGYKNLGHKQNFPHNIQSALEFAQTINHSNWEKIYPLLERSIATVKKDLEVIIASNSI